jgi:hypothetical protein
MAGRMDLSGWFRLMEMSRTGGLLRDEADLILRAFEVEVELTNDER